MTIAVILAGGLGTRLKEAVPDLPKPMAPIRGRPFLEYQMDYWINQGVTQFILSVGYLKEMIMDFFGSQYHNVSIEYAVEDEPLGTGGGLLMAAKGLSETFLVINGDTFIEVDLKQLLNFHIEHKSEWTFSLFRTNYPGRYMGLDVAKDGKILSFQSGLSHSSHLANGGVYLMNPSVLDRLDYQACSKISLEDGLLPDFISAGGATYGMECPGIFIDIGVPEDYRRAVEILPQ